MFANGMYRLGVTTPPSLIRLMNARDTASCRSSFCGAVRPCSAFCNLDIIVEKPIAPRMWQTTISGWIHFPPYGRLRCNAGGKDPRNEPYPARGGVPCLRCHFGPISKYALSGFYLPHERYENLRSDDDSKRDKKPGQAG